MTGREKAAVGVCALAVGAFAAYVAFVRPAVGRVETLRRRRPEMERELGEVQAKAQEIAALLGELEALKQRRQPLDRADRDFALMTYLERLQRESDLRGRVEMVERSAPLGDDYDERVVDMRLEGVSWQEVVRLLEKIESSDVPLRTSELALRRDARRPETLNVTVQVRMLALAGER